MYVIILIITKFFVICTYLFFGAVKMHNINHLHT
jgi:hypothetical protein